jgi:hypothetical protein
MQERTPVLKRCVERCKSCEFLLSALLRPSFRAPCLLQCESHANARHQSTADAMLRRSLLPRAIAALRRHSTRSAGGWSPRLPTAVLASSSGSAAAAAEVIKAERVKPIAPRSYKVVCQNWQRFGSCRYGVRCAFAAGHVDGERLKPRSNGQR